MSFRIVLPSLHRRHRHVLALPLAAVLALIPLADFGREFTLPASVATTWTAGDTEQMVAIPHGRVLLLPGAALRQEGEQLMLEHGSVLIAADDLVRMAAGPWQVAVFDGAAHITLQGTLLTAAGISAPVSARLNGRGMLIPAGAQWRGDGNAPTIEDGIDPWVAGHALLPLPEDFVADQLRRTAIRSARADAGDNPPATMIAQFSSLMQDTEAWLLASAHPRTAGLAWVAQTPEAASAEDRLLRIMTMPRADIQRDPFPPLAADRWFDAVTDLIPRMPEPDITLLNILTLARTAAADAAVRGQPERAQRYRELSERLLMHFALLLTDTQRAALPPDHPQPVTVADTAQHAPIQPSEGPASAAMIAGVREALLPIGALYTAQTAIADIGGDARITGIGFATSAGDRLFDLTLNLSTLTVRDIRRDGETFVNEVTLQQFMEWVGR